MIESKVKIERGQGNSINLEMDGIRVWLDYNSDGEPFVQIQTPEDSDVWEFLRVYMNDGEAVGWR